MAATPRHPFRFSASLGGITDARSLREWALRIEDLGYSTATMADHFDDQLGPIAALQAAADATTTLKVASLMFANDYRHPVVLAKEAATLDALTDGRFEMGLGAGWMESDYRGAGLPYDPPGTRVERLEESVGLLRELWSGAPVSHAGTHYQVDGVTGSPAPATPGGPPLVLGGGGRRVLQLAARLGDIVAVNPRLTAGRFDASAGSSATPEATDRKLQWIRDASGDRIDQLELQVRIHLVSVTDDADALLEALAGGFGLTLEEARGTPHGLVGTVDQICDALVERRERWGISYIGVPTDGVEALAPVVERLAGT
jgi:probable F420-dependent oxidoreductase